MTEQDPLSLMRMRAFTGWANKTLSRVMILLWVMQVAVDSPSRPLSLEREGGEEVAGGVAGLAVMSQGAGVGLPALAAAAAMAALFCPQEAHAVLKTWANGSNGSWSTGTWSPAGVPASTDTVCFNGTTSNYNCILDGNITVTRFRVQSNYAGTISQGANTITVSDSFSMAGGTFSGGSKKIDINGSFFLRGGIFAATADTLEVGLPDVTANDTIFKVAAGAAFAHNNGTLKFNAYGASGGTAIKYIDVNGKLDLNNVDYFNSSGSGGKVQYWLDTADTLVINGDVYINGTTASGTMLYYGTNDLKGDLISGNGTASPISGVCAQGTALLLSGTTNQLYSDSINALSRSAYLGHVTINKPSNSKVVVPVGCNLRLTGGPSGPGGQTLTITAGSILDCQGEYFQTRRDLIVAGTIILRGDTVCDPGPVTISPTGAIIKKGAGRFSPKGLVQNDGLLYLNGMGGLSGNTDNIKIQCNGGTPPRTYSGSGSTYFIDANIMDTKDSNGTIIVRSCFDSIGNSGIIFIDDTVRYSIGTNSGTIYGTGVATTNRSTIVTFAGGANLPANVGEGDMIIFDPNSSTFLGPDTCYIRSRDNAAQVTLQLPPMYNYGNEDYIIKRAFNSIQAWENASPTDLVPQKIVWKGICYNDGIFNGYVEFNGTAADSAHYLWLTAAVSSRHSGKAGTGVRINNNIGSLYGAIHITASNPYVRVENLEMYGSTANCIGVSAGSSGGNIYLNNLIIHDLIRGVDAINGNTPVRITNTIIYNATETGVSSSSTSRVNCYNVTLLKQPIFVSSATSGFWQCNVRNCIGLNYGTASAHVCFYNCTGNYNLSSDASAPGANSLLNKTAYAQFVDTNSATIDLHLKSGADAINAGSSAGLNGFFTTDIDGQTRNIGNWDIGADEWAHPMTWNASATGNWSTPGNWYGGVVPGAGDTVFFDATSTKQSLVDAGFGGTVRAIVVNPGYTDTIKLQRNLIIDGNSDNGNKLKMASGATGKFSLGTYTLQLNSLAGLDLSGGTFLAGTGKVYFNQGTSPNLMNTGTQQLYDMEFNKTGQNWVAVTGHTVVTHTLTMTAGGFDGDTIEARGNVTYTKTGFSYNGSGTLLFGGNASQTFSGGGPSEGGDVKYLGNIIVDKTGGTLTLQDTISINQYWIHKNGVVDAGTSCLSGFDGSSATKYIDAANMAFNNLRIASAGGWGVQLNSNIRIKKDLTIMSTGKLDLNGKTITIAGNWTNNNMFVHSNGTVVFDSTTNSTLNTNGTGANRDFYNLTINKTRPGQAALSTNDINISNNFNITNGDFVQAAQNMTAAALTIGTNGSYVNNSMGDLTLGGNVTNNGYIRLDANGAGCGGINNIKILSSAAVQRTWGGTGQYYFIDDSVQYQAGSFTAYGSTNVSNNTWTFNACPTPGLVTWTGGGADNNWTTVGNWSSGAVPTNTQIAIFDNTSDKSCTINSNANVAGIDINVGYDGTITQSGINTVTIGSSGYDQTAGTFAGGTKRIDCQGNFVLSGGTFTSTSDSLWIDGNNLGITISGGTFNHNSGTLYSFGMNTSVSIGSATLWNWVLNSGNNLTITGTVDVNGNLYAVNANTFTGGSITLAGNYVAITANHSTYTTLLTLDGSGAQTLGGNGTNNEAWAPKITIASSGTVTLQDSLFTQGNWTYTSGTIIPGTSTVVFTNATTTINAGSTAFNNVVFSTVGNITITGSMNINGDLVLTNMNSFDGGILAVAGNVIDNQTNVISGTAAITMNGAANKTLSQVTNAFWPSGNFTISKTGGAAVSLASNARIPGALTVNTGTFSQGASYGMRVDGAITVNSGGSWSNTGTGYDSLGSTVTCNAGGNITLNGNSAACGEADAIQIRSTATPTQRAWSGTGAFSITDVDLKDMSSTTAITAYSSTNSGNVTGSWTVNGTCPVTSNFTWIAGAHGRWATGANWQGGVAPGAGDTAFFDNSSIQNCTLSVDPNVKGIQIKSGYTGIIKQGIGVTLTVGSGGFSQAAGTFTGGNNRITLNGAYSLSSGAFTSTSDSLWITNNANVTISGGTFNANSGNVYYTANATINTGGVTLNNLIISSNGDLTVAGTVNVAGFLFVDHINSMSGGTIAVTGDVTSKAQSVSTPMNTLIELIGTGAQMLGAGGSNGRGYLPAIEIAQTGGGTLTMQDSLFVGGDWIFTSSGSVAPGTSTVKLWNGTQAIKPGSMSFNNLVISIGGNFRLAGGDMNVSGCLSIISCNSYDSSHTINVAGNLANNQTSISGPRNTSLCFAGGNDQTLTAVPGAIWPSTAIAVDKSGGSLILASNVYLDQAGQDLRIYGGAVKNSSYNLRVADTIYVGDGSGYDALIQGSGGIRADGGIVVANNASWQNTSTGDDTVGASGVTNAGVVILDANNLDCAGSKDILIRSTSSGVQRPWYGAGNFALYGVDVQDQGGPAAIGVRNSTLGTGMGANWTSASCTPITVSSSIGYSTMLYSGTGNATTNATKDTITLSSGTFPDTVGEGDSIRIGATPLTGLILTKIGAAGSTRIALQGALSSSQTNANITIYRRFTDLQSWENAAPVNLVANATLWKGLCYANISGGLNFRDKFTSPNFYLWLTVPLEKRHKGKAGTGVIYTLSGSNEIVVQQDYTIMDGFEITGTTSASEAIQVGAWGSGNYSVLKNCLLYNISTAYLGAISIGNMMAASGIKLQNCVIYNIDRNGISTAAYSSTYSIYNCTVFKCNTINDAYRYGIAVNSGNTATITNCIAMNNGTADINISGSATQSYNITSDATASGTGSKTGRVPTAIFVDTNTASRDLHMKAGSPAIDSGTSLAGYFTDDIDGATRPLGNAWDIGADEFTNVYDTLIRSIGTRTTAVYTGTTNASTSSAGDTITLSSGIFPDSCGEGDSVRIGSVCSFIQNRVGTTGSTRIYLQTPVTGGLSGQSISVYRCYNSLQTWEYGAPSSLVAQNCVYKGVAYDDRGDLGSVSIGNDHTVDSVHFFWLTVAPCDRHNGTPGSGLVIDKAGASTAAIQTDAAYTIIDGFEIKNATGVFADNCAISERNANITICNNLIYNTSAYARQGYGLGPHYGNNVRDNRIYNNIIYNKLMGIRVSMYSLTRNCILNNTIFNCDTGIYAQVVGGTSANDTIKNNVSIRNSANYVIDNLSYVIMDYNAGESGNMPGEGSNNVTTTTYETFVDTNTSSMNLHLRATSPCVNAGTPLSSYFTTDIDGATRTDAWDIGADEHSGYTQAYFAGMNEYNIGTRKYVPAKVSNITGTGPWTVSFSNSPDLSRTFANDCFTDGWGRKWKIAGTGANQVTVSNSEYAAGESPAPTAACPNGTVGRWYNTLQGWEDARQGDLVSRNAVEKGVCYNDGPFTAGVTIDGSTTDAAHYLWLTVALGERHDGKRYTPAGVRIEQAQGFSAAVENQDAYTHITWLQTKLVANYSRGFAGAGGGSNDYTIVENCICWYPGGLTFSGGSFDGFAISLFGTDSRAQNNVIYGPWNVGVLANGTSSVLNNTVYKAVRGIQLNGQYTSPNLAKNNISFQSSTADYDTINSASSQPSASCGWNISSMPYAPGSSNRVNQTVAQVKFVDTTTGSEDFHLQAGSVAINNADSTGLSQYFAVDIDDTIRHYLKWDIGADEYPGLIMSDTSQWYVDYRKGSDAANGRSITTAFKTIQYAYTQLADGAPADSVYVINLLPGTHIASSAITINSSGPIFSAVTPLIIRSYYPSPDSMAKVAATSLAANLGVFAPTVSNVIFERIQVRGATGGKRGIGCSNASTPDNITIRNCVFSMDSIKGSDNFYMDTAVYLGRATNVGITNNIFLGKGSSSATARGMAIYVAGNNAKIINNDFYNVSYGWSMDVTGGSTGSIFANNLFDTVSYAYAANAAADVVTCYNCGFGPGMSYANYSTVPGKMSPVSEVPCASRPVLSYSAGAGDFVKLRKGAELIDRGKDTTGAPATDFYGITRTSIKDIGACEYSPYEDRLYADTVNLFVDFDKADNSGDGRTIATAKKHVDSALALIPAGTVDSTYIINLMPSASPYTAAGGSGKILRLNCQSRYFPSWTKCIVIQSYYANKDSLAILTAPGAGTIGFLYLYDDVGPPYDIRNIHLKRLRFVPGNSGQTFIAFELYGVGKISNIKISECIFDTGAGQQMGNALAGFSAYVDSMDVTNNIFVGNATSGDRVFGAMNTCAGAQYGVRFANNTVNNLEAVLESCNGNGSGCYTLLNNVFSNITSLLLPAGPTYNSNLYQEYNCYYNTGTLVYGSNVIGLDSIMRDPQILSFAWSNPNFGKLSDVSPCIGFGKDSVMFSGGQQVRVTPDKDLWGVARVTGNDLGACQYDETAVAGKRIFQEGVHGGAYGTIEDARIYGFAGSQDYNFGGASDLRAAGSQLWKSIIRLPQFTGNASSLQVSGNAHVDSAFLFLYQYGGTGAGDVEAYRLTRDWTEGGANGALQAGSACWNAAKYGAANWAMPGADALSDREPANAATAATSSAGWIKLNITGMVQDWVSGLTNYGLILSDQDGNVGPTQIQYYSSEYPIDKSLHPKLVVYYDTDTVTIVKQEGTTPGDSTRDTYIRSAGAGNNYGAAPTLVLDSTGGTRDHILLQNNRLVGNGANDLPAGAGVRKAELTLYRSNTTSLNANASKAYGLREYWVEGTQNGTSGTANWNNSDGSAWSGAGATGASRDANTMSTGNTANNTIGGPVVWQCDTAIQHIADGTANYGLTLQPAGTIAAGVAFYSRNGTAGVGPFYNPKLTVTYAGQSGFAGNVPWKKPAMPLLKLYTNVNGSGATLNFQRGVTTSPYDSTDDVYANNASPGTNYNAAGDYLTLTDTANAGAKKTLLMFRNFVGNSVGQVPAGSVIDTAYLQLVEYNGTLTADIAVNLYQVNESWWEGQASWNNRTGSAWTNAGVRGPSSATLIYSGATLTRKAGNGGTNDTVYIPMKQLVQAWVNGAASNYGIMVAKIGATSDGAQFYNSENGTNSRNPKLVVAFRKVEQIEVQNLGKYATNNSYFSSLDTLKNQFFLSFNTRTDSTDGMMNQWKTAATSPGQQVRQSFELLPSARKHYNFFNVVRAASTADSSWYADSVRAADTLSFAVIESTTTRMRYRINERKVWDRSNPRNAKVRSEFTVYPTGQIFVWDSSMATANAGTNYYGVQFGEKLVGGDGTSAAGSTAAYDSLYGGIYNTKTGQGSLHDFAAGFLSRTLGATVDTPFTSAAVLPGNSGIYLKAANDAKWNSTATAWRQTFFVDFSRDDMDKMDSLRNLVLDKKKPAAINTWLTGSLKTNASGDINTDGFNEREGCYELNSAAGTVQFYFNENSGRTRYYPVFKMNGYTYAYPPQKVLLQSIDQKVTDTLYASTGDANISLCSPGASGYVIFQLNRVINGPCIIYADKDGAPPASSNQPPVFTSSPVTFTDQRKHYTYQATATDVNLDPVTFSLVTYPAGMSVNPGSGLLQWTANLAGDQSVRIRASDGQTTADQVYTLHVYPDTIPPDNDMTLTANFIGSGKIRVTWTPVSIDSADADSVGIWYKTTDYPDSAGDVSSTLLRKYPRSVSADTLAGSLLQKHVYWFAACVRDSSGNWSDTSHTARDTAYVPDLAPPDNDMTLTANWLAGNNIRLTWNPGSIDSTDADSVGIWYKTSDYPDSANDVTATLAGKYPRSVNSDTLSGFSDKTLYWFSLMVRDSSANWSDTFHTACDTAWTPDATPPQGLAGFTASAAAGGQVNLSWDTTGKSNDAWRVIIRYNPSTTPAPAYPVDTTQGSFVGRFDLTTLSHPHAGLPSHRYYWYSAWVIDSSSNVSIVSQDSAWLPDLSPPDNDMTLTANWLTGNSVRLTWNPASIDSADADSVGIWYKTMDYPDSAHDVTATLAGKFPRSVSSDTISGLSEKTLYWFSLMARDSSANWSDTFHTACDTAWMPDVTPPSALIGITAAAGPGKAVSLSWDTTGKSSDAFRIIVRYNMSSSPVATYPADTSQGSLLGPFAITPVSYVHPGLMDKRYYWYSAWVMDSSSNLSTVKQDSAWVPDLTPPDNDMTLSAQWLSGGSIRLSWNPGSIDSSDADSVGIWYKTANYPDSAGDVAATLAGKYPRPVNSDTLSGFSEKTLYWFSLMVRDTSGNWSDTFHTACDTARVPDQTPPDNALYRIGSISALSDSSIRLAISGLGGLTGSDAKTVSVRMRDSGYVLNTAVPPDTLTALSDSVIVFSGLPAFTRYYFTVSVSDSAGNYAAIGPDDRDTVRTLAPPVPGGNYTVLASAAGKDSVVARLFGLRALHDTLGVDSIGLWVRSAGWDTVMSRRYAEVAWNDTVIGIGGLGEKIKYWVTALVHRPAMGWSIVDTAHNVNAATTWDRTPPSNSLYSLSAHASSEKTIVCAISGFGGLFGTDALSAAINYGVAGYDTNFFAPDTAIPLSDSMVTIPNLLSKQSYYLTVSVRDSSGNWASVSTDDRALVKTPDLTPPDNDMTLTAAWLSGHDVRLSWNPASIDSADADSVGIWYKTGDYPDSANDVTALLAGKYPRSVNSDTLTSLNEKTLYWFSLMVRDSSANWSDTSQAACDTAKVPDKTPPAALAGLTALPAAGAMRVAWDTAGKSSDAFRIILRYSETVTSAPAYPADTGAGILIGLFALDTVIHIQAGILEKRHYWYSAWVMDSAGNVSAVRQTGSLAPDLTPPDNDMTLSALWLAGHDIRLSWNPASIDSSDADSVGIWYKTTDYPDSVNDVSAILAGKYPRSVSSDTLSGFNEKTLVWFSLMVRDTSANWSDTFRTACNTAYVPDRTPPAPLAAFTAAGLSKGRVSLAWDAAGRSSDAYQVVVRYNMTVSPAAFYPADTSAGLPAVKISLDTVTCTRTGLSEKRYYWYSAWVIDSSSNVSTVRQDSAWTPDFSPPDNDMTLVADWAFGKSVRFSWNPASIDSVDADSVGIWYRPGAYPDSARDPAAVVVRKYPLNVKADTVGGFSDKRTYHFSLMVRDTSGNWSGTAISASDTAFMPDVTPPVNTLHLVLKALFDSAITVQWNPGSLAGSDADSAGIWYSITSLPQAPHSATATLLGTYALSDSTDTLWNLKGRAKYYFGISARDTAGNWAGIDSVNRDSCSTRPSWLVFPGDCNNDSAVNVADILPVGVYFGRTGPSRADLGLDSSRHRVVPWDDTSMAAYADADGSGKVDIADVLILASHWHNRWNESGVMAKRLADKNPVRDPLPKSFDAARYEAYSDAYLSIYNAIKSNRDKAGFKEIVEFLEEFLFVRLPGEYCLYQNFPNPFNPATTIKFDIPALSGQTLMLKSEFKSAKPVDVLINIYNIRGQLVRSLTREKLKPGYHAVQWDGKDTRGQYMASGIYFYRIISTRYIKTRKMVCIK